MSPIRVLIAEDEPGVRQALSELITDEASLELVGAAGNAVQAVELAQAHRPDIALVDVKMPGGGGPRAATGIRSSSPQTRVLALSAYDDRDSVLEMLRAGRSEEHTSELQSRGHLVCRLLLEKKKT